MRKGIMGFEDFEEPVEVVVEGEADLAVAEGETLTSELANDSDQLAETESIADSVDTLTDQVEAKVEDGEGISEDTAAALEVAVEHFKLRLGYAKKIVPAMEGFKDSATRLDKTKVTLENLKELQAGLNKNLAVAQEGFFDKISDAITFAFDTEVKVIAKVKAASSVYDAKGPSEKTIESPKWGRHLFGGHGAEYTGKDAEAALSTIEKMINDTKLKQNIAALAKCLEKLTEEVRGNWFLSNKNDIERIEAVHAEVTKLRDDIIHLTGGAKSSTATKYVPLNTADKKKITTSIISVLTDTELKKEINNFTSKSGSLANWSAWNANLRLKSMIGGVAASATGIGGVAKLAMGMATGLMAEDISKARKANKEAWEIVKAIKEILDTRIKFGTGIASYIEASAA